MILLSLLLLAVSPQDQDPDIFRFGVEVRTVYVDVFVSHEGQPVTDLTARDFEVRDNGIRQNVQHASLDVKPLSAMLLLDISGSVSGERLNDLRAAAHAFLDGLESRDEAGVLTFTRKMRLLEGVSTDVPALHRAVDQHMDAGKTGLNDAIYAGLKLVEGRDGRPLVLLFSDGLDNTSWLTESEVLGVVKASQAVVHVVGVRTPQPLSKGIGGRPSRRKVMVLAAEFLEELTSTTGGRIWAAESTGALKDIYLSVLAEMKSSYLLSFRLQGVAQDGWHELEVKVKGGKADDVRARSGYMLTASRD